MLSKHRRTKQLLRTSTNRHLIRTIHKIPHIQSSKKQTDSQSIYKYFQYKV